MEDVKVTFISRLELEALFCISTNQQKFVISEIAAVFIYRSTETGLQPTKGGGTLFVLCRIKNV